jgi:branched-chain amino acid transport system ATP-binding protein
LLEVSGLAVRYDGAVVALDGVDLRVEEGGIVALLGPNGAGKSTLLKAIAGLLPFERGEVSAGTIRLDGAPIERLHPVAIARAGVSLVQEGRQCFRSLSVGENLDAALEAAGSRRQELALAYEYFPMLREMRARPAGFLSGGQLQMMVIAMALLGGPRLLLLDEPSLGLSPIVVQGVFDAVERMHRELGVTLLVAEQTVPRLLAMATQTIVLRNGAVAASGSELAPEAIERAYLS